MVRAHGGSMQYLMCPLGMEEVQISLKLGKHTNSLFMYILS